METGPRYRGSTQVFLFLHNFHPLSQQTDTAYLSKVSILVYMGIGLVAAVIGIVQIEVCDICLLNLCYDVKLKTASHGITEN